MSSLIEGRGFQRYRHNLELLDMVARARGGTPRTPVTAKADGDPAALGMAKAEPMDRFQPVPLTAYYFTQTMELLRNAGIPVVVLAVPTDRPVRDTIGQEPFRAYARFVDETARQYNSPVRQTRLTEPWPGEYFFDGRHMTEEGAALFTRRLGACLQQWTASPGAVVECDLGWP